MKMSKKVMMLGISLMLVSLVLIGCITQSISEQATEIKDPIFTLQGFVFDLVWYYPVVPIKYPEMNDSMISFNLIIENPNNESIQIEVLSCNIIDYFVNSLLSFRPEICPYVNYISALSTDAFILEANQNIILSHYKVIHRNYTSENVFNYPDDSLSKVRISGLYRINGELQWFESNLCEINIPI